jgi:hypothetical protein
VQFLALHNLDACDKPIYYGCGGIVALRADYWAPPYRKPGTKCTTVFEDAIGCLAGEQAAARWPLLIAVQTSTPLAISATPGLCDIDARNNLPPGMSENFMSFLGRNKWDSYWEGATGSPREPGHCHVARSSPFPFKQTFFCLVQNPYNPSPDVR